MSRLQYFFSMKSRNRADALRLELIELAGSKCLKCGFDDVRALVVHHPNHDRKYSQVSELKQMLLGHTKYEVLCQNCHAIAEAQYYAETQEPSRILQEILMEIKRFDDGLTLWFRREFQLKRIRGLYCC